MVKVVIGSVVLCHLLMPTTAPQQQEGGPAVTKILGEVVDIQSGSRYIEKKETKQALRVDTDILVVKGKNKEGLYQIDSRACMLVRDESPAEKEERLFPKTKVVEKESVSEDEEEVKEKNSADLEIQDRPVVEDLSPEEKLPKLSEKDLKDLEELSKPKVEPKQDVPAEETKVVAPEVKVEEKPAEPTPEVKKTNKSLLDYIK